MRYGIFLIGVLLPAVLILLKGHGKRHEAWQAEVEVTEILSGQHSRIKSPIREGLLKDRRFYILLPGYLAIPVFSTSVFFFQETLLSSKGWPVELFAFSFPFFAVAMTLATPLCGFLVDKFGNSAKLLPVAYLPFAAALIVLGMAEHSLWLPAMMVVMGLSSGFLSVLGGTLWAEMYGTQMLGSTRAFMTSLMVFGTAAAPAIMGYLYDSGLSIRTSYFAFAAYMAFFSLMQMKMSGRLAIYKRP